MPGIVESAAANNNYDATFRADLALKDLTLATQAGTEADLRLTAAELAKAQLQALADEGLGHKDCTLITKYVSPEGEAPGYTAEHDVADAA